MEIHKIFKYLFPILFILLNWSLPGKASSIPSADSIRKAVLHIFNEGNPKEESFQKLRDLLEICKKNGYLEEEGMTLSVLSNHFNIRNQDDSSLHYIKACLQVRKQLNNPQSLSRTYFLLAKEFFENSFNNFAYVDSALMNLETAKESANDTDTLLNLSIALLMGEIYNSTGAPEKAMTILEGVVFPENINSFSLCSFYYEKARSHYYLQQYKQGLFYIDSAFQVKENPRVKNLYYKLHLLKTLVYTNLGNPDSMNVALSKAKESFHNLFPDSTQSSYFLEKGRIKFMEGEILRHQNLFKESIKQFENSIESLELSKTGDHLFVHIYQGLADSYSQLGNWESGMEAYKQANTWRAKLYDQAGTKNVYRTEVSLENTDLKRSNTFYQELTANQRISMRIQQIAGGSILTVLLFFFYQLFQRQKIQKQLIATKNQLLVEKEQTHKQRLMALTGRYNERMAQTVMEVQQDAQAKFRKQMIEVGEELHDFAQGKIAISKTLLTKLRDDLNSKLTDQDQQNYDLIAEAMQAAHLEIREQSHRLQEGQALDLQINLKDFLHKLQQDLGPLQQIGELNLQLETQNLDQVSFAEKEFLDVIGLIQGAINNVILHAEADTVLVRLEKQANTFNIEIADDGKGFKVAEGDEIQSGGMHALKNRVERLGGDLEIFSQAGKGTRLIAAIPLT